MNLAAAPLRSKSWLLLVALSLLALLGLAAGLLARPAATGPGAAPASAGRPAVARPLIVVRKSARAAGRPKVVRALPPASAPTRP